MTGVAERTCSSQGNEPSSSAATSDEPKPGFDELVQSVRKMEADQTTFKQTVMENLNVLNMKMGVLVAASGSTQKEGNERKRKREDIGESDEGSSKKKDASSEQKQIVPQKPIPAKIFVLKHVVGDVSNLEEGDVFQFPTEEHFGVTWGITIGHKNEHLGLYLNCASRGNYCIEIRWIIELKNKSGTTMRKKHATKYTENDKLGKGLNVLRWDDLVQNYSINDTLTVKMQIEIIKMVGVYKENLRCFGSTMEDCSDITLIVKDQKFFLSKLYLASQSPYFKGMLIGNFRESKETEVVLNGIDPDDFQNYLEALYGEPAIDETTIEGILQVADMCDTPLISRKCEEYLMERSNKSDKKKFELSIRYKLNKLQKDCLDNIKSMEDFRSTVPSNVRGLDQSLTTVLLEKAISLD